ncbi:MAG: aminotransferase class I/II-fold pyridoxal phosphate-dependent enzyme [Bacteroidia bacterium]|nr:aminotransferase class I/II-fold pyridoxal phosphate-dependent enzyme [Bacteroidia bacterium]
MPRVNQMAENLMGSQILELSDQIRQKLRAGEQIFDLTIGDFDSVIFPIPELLKDAVSNAYAQNFTNYPATNGTVELRTAIAAYTRSQQKLDYPANDVLVSSGARPLIYAAYITLLNPGEKIIYPVPSWNNHFYTHLAQASGFALATHPEDNFMPTAQLLEPHLGQAGLLSLCSPLNPAGTVFSRKQLADICELVLAENRRRGLDAKPLYILYDQIYRNLTYGDTQHFDPVSLYPEMKPFTIYIDGISKAFAATGLRMGWAFGPSDVIGKMKLLLAHIGSWPSHPLQQATAEYLGKTESVNEYLTDIKEKLNQRLVKFYEGFCQLKNSGYPVDAISPQAALYLTVKIDLRAFQTPDAKPLLTGRQVYQYLLNEAGVAMVPFYAFGLEETSVWFRLSVGTAHLEDIPEIIHRLERALAKVTR